MGFVARAINSSVACTTAPYTHSSAEGAGEKGSNAKQPWDKVRHNSEGLGYIAPKNR